MKQRLTRYLLSTVGAIALMALGCAAGGTAFQPAEEIAEGKALVYIYRPNSMIGGAIRYHVAAGDKRIVYVIRGGYYPYLAEPGETEFWARTEGKASVTKDIEPGKTYYLRCTVTFGLAVGRPKLEFVGAEVGEKEVRKLKLLPKAEGT